jgi:alpha-L-fucosidase
LATAISNGGNYLLNIGPDHNGKLLTLFEERLNEIGQFVNTHADAIFATKPWIFQSDSGPTWSAFLLYTLKHSKILRAQKCTFFNCFLSFFNLLVPRNWRLKND